ncbi:unnamed protein product [Rotaria sp. Silwood2]|nr:unnamed protein product [Rotaria sp. Silwood2]CAF3983759.1 unnamed protein product [Rotaria sp. Silwood2]
MTSEENYFVEEKGIDQDRVVDDRHHVVNELCCAICQGLLWKPRSCASCQHLFCNQCIRTWLKFNPTSCPFRCSPYEEKRAPPHIHSLLGRLSIRCRNNLFGCTEILSYDLLEQHESVECQFPTKHCNTCGKYILISEIDQHKMLCIPATIQCFICKCFVDRTEYRRHTIKCCQERLDLLIEQMIPSPDDFEIPENNNFTFPQEHDNGTGFTQLYNQLQRFLSVMPKVNLVEFDAVVQARQQNCSARIWTMLRLILFNKSQAAQIMFILFWFGIGSVVGLLVCLYLFIQRQVAIAMCRSFVFIILFSGLFSFGLPVLLASVSDTWIILLTIVSLILLSSASPGLQLDYMQLDQSNKLLLVLYFISLLGFKLSVLMIRFYCSCIPSYITAGCLAWITIFVTFHVRRFSIGTR